MITARVATPSDAAAWHTLRLDALRLHPTAFLTTYEEAAALPPEAQAERLAAGNSFIVIDQQTPIGIAALIPLDHRIQTRHRAEIGAVYIAGSHHGTGAAATLMDAMETHATRLGVWQLELFVEASNTRAQAFYERRGFTTAGRLPNAVVGPNGPADDLFMIKDLRNAHSGLL